jgi:hypothetical protein
MRTCQDFIDACLYHNSKLGYGDESQAYIDHLGSVWADMSVAEQASSMQEMYEASPEYCGE